MQRTMRVSLAAAISAVALAGAGFHSAKAADVAVPQYQAPPAAAYAPPPVVVWPRPYYWPRPYWRGPRFAYGYGGWGHGYWGHGWHR